jgi:hypothetical protein
MKRNLSKVSYTDHLLSSLISLKRNIYSSIWMGGGFWEVGQDFETLQQLFLVSLEHITCLYSSYSWVICLSPSHTNSMCCHIILTPSKRTFGFNHIIFGFMPRRVNVAKSLVVSHNVQGNSQLQSTYVLLSIFIHVSVCPHSLYHLKSLS